jgi:hypothetical protein
MVKVQASWEFIANSLLVTYFVKNSGSWIAF